MAEWYWYAGYVALVLVIFFYFATRKRYRDPTAAPNYEKVRNKVTIREEEKEPEIEVSLAGSTVISMLPGFISLALIIFIGVSLIGPIANQVNLAMNENSLSNNATSSASLMLSSGFTMTILKLLPAFFVLMILGIVIAILFNAFRMRGIV